MGLKTILLAEFSCLEREGIYFVTVRNEKVNYLLTQRVEEYVRTLNRQEAWMVANIILSVSRNENSLMVAETLLKYRPGNDILSRPDQLSAYDFII